MKNFFPLLSSAPSLLIRHIVSSSHRIHVTKEKNSLFHFDRIMGFSEGVFFGVEILFIELVGFFFRIWILFGEKSLSCRHRTNLSRFHPPTSFHRHHRLSLPEIGKLSGHRRWCLAGAQHTQWLVNTYNVWDDNWDSLWWASLKSTT